jgi:hypothetical protein
MCSVRRMLVRVCRRIFKVYRITMISNARQQVRPVVLAYYPNLPRLHSFIHSNELILRQGIYSEHDEIDCDHRLFFNFGIIVSNCRTSRFEFGIRTIVLHRPIGYRNRIPMICAFVSFPLNFPDKRCTLSVQVAASNRSDPGMDRS